MTLIEVLVASVLLGVGVTGLISVSTLSLRNQQRTELRSSALCLAQDKLANVELLGAHVWMLGHPTQGSERRGSAQFNWTITIEQLSVGELFSVRIEVRWLAPGSNGEITIETWLNDYEAVKGPTKESAASPTGAPAQPSAPPGR